MQRCKWSVRELRVFWYRWQLSNLVYLHFWTAILTQQGDQWKEPVAAHFRKLFHNFSEGLKETKKNIGQNIQSHGQESSHRPPKYMRRHANHYTMTVIPVMVSDCFCLQKFQKCHFLVWSMLLTVDLIQDTQRCYDISIHLPICMAAKWCAIIALVSGCKWNPHSKSSFHYMWQLHFLNYAIIHSLKFYLLYIVIVTRNAKISWAKNGYFCMQNISNVLGKSYFSQTTVHTQLPTQIILAIWSHNLLI
jgi:hypothetical protein